MIPNVTEAAEGAVDATVSKAEMDMHDRAFSLNRRWCGEL
jgi:hypothetical protein